MIPAPFMHALGSRNYGTGNVYEMRTYTFAPGDIPKVPLNLVLLKGCQIVGVFWGAFAMRDPVRTMANTQKLFRWFEEGKLKPYVSATYPFERAGEALNEIAQRRAKGKIVVVP